MAVEPLSGRGWGETLAPARAAGVGALSGGFQLPLHGRSTPPVRPRLAQSCSVVAGCLALRPAFEPRSRPMRPSHPCRAPRRGGWGAEAASRGQSRFLGVAKPPNHSFLNKAAKRHGDAKGA